ncbi:MAG: DNA alkylation repair protein [Calditrichaeota bacterium]|nr:DNA alkylation repair protein [Calditrichota bacterium]
MSHPLIDALRSALAAAVNPADAAAMQRYMKSTMPFRGVKTGIQRQIRLPLFKLYPITSFQEYEAVIKELWTGEDGMPYREERYAAIAVAGYFKKFCTMEALPLYRMMIETGAWWDFVDGISIDLLGGLLLSYPAEMKPELYRWIEDDHLWIRRAAIIAQEKFKSATDEKMLFDFCECCLDEKEFWIRKAIGWALRSYSKHKPKAVRYFVEQYRQRMSGVTLKEAMKYI